MAAQLLAPPLAWFAELQLNYAIANSGCPSGSPPGGRLVLIGVSAIAVLVALVATWSSWRQWRAIDEATPAADRFLTTTALGLGAFLSLVIVAQALPLGWFPCG